MADPRVTLQRDNFPKTTGGQLTTRQILSMVWVGISWNGWGAGCKYVQKIWAILSLTENPYRDLELRTVAPERHSDVTISQNKRTENLNFYTVFTEERCCHT